MTQVSESAVNLLDEIRRLMELKGENPFKIRAYDQATRVLAGRTDLLEMAQKGTLTKIPGIGKGIEEILKEFLLYGRTSLRDELLQSLPAGLLELTEVPGLGPKKAKDLIEKLGIQSVVELEYACKENRLLKLKGYGPKLQQKILEGIQFQSFHRGWQKLGDVLETVEGILKDIHKEFPHQRISETGALRRKSEILNEFEFLIETKEILKKDSLETLETLQSRYAFPVRFHFSPPENFGYELARTTGTVDHWQALGNPKSFEASTEEEFYKSLKLPWIPPEVRETGEEVELAKKGFLSELLPWDGIRGVFHNHTTRSDGTATLEQMVEAAEQLGYEYIGISDHSQSAVYAQGLKLDAIRAQENEIRQVQKKHPRIRIFWGIESDILMDGSLDYDAAILERFDFVIASIHSRFQMDRDQMTQRILRAVQNPYTRFLGHPTGRLLLGRKAYDLDMEAILVAAAKHNVAVELNANPSRLDIDWHWGPIMRKHQTLTSINPDAHEVAGLKHTKIGVAMARKALLSVHHVVNSRSVQEVEKWLKRA